MIAKLIESWVTCKKLRGTTSTQHKAILPPEKTESYPPFTNVGFVCSVSEKSPPETSVEIQPTPNVGD